MPLNGAMTKGLQQIKHKSNQVRIDLAYIGWPQKSPPYYVTVLFQDIDISMYAFTPGKPVPLVNKNFYLAIS